MASRGAIGEMRNREMRRIRELLGVDFRFTRGGPEMQHVTNLRAIADALEKRQQQAAPPKPPENKGAQSHGREAIRDAVRGVGPGAQRG